MLLPFPFQALANTAEQQAVFAVEVVQQAVFAVEVVAAACEALVSLNAP